MKILRIGCVLGGFFSMVLSMPAQTFTAMHSFDQTDGANSQASLIQATNGNFYGTTSWAGGSGVNSCGTVFGITPTGKLTMVYSFPGYYAPDGCTSVAPLVQGTNGNFYGTTSRGGDAPWGGGGTVFEITPGGKLTTLHGFCLENVCPNEEGPRGGLVLGTDGNFYGTTSNNDIYGPMGGTVFKITPSGVLTTLYTFCSQVNCADGNGPYGGMVQGTDGNFYGTTILGGIGGGTVFKITPTGTLTTLHGFEGPDGSAPVAGLIQASDGNFYGTTSYGGANNPGGGAGYNYGTAFQITPSGTLTTLYNFCSQIQDGTCLDGNSPAAALVEATDGTLYGTTAAGGNGTVCYPDGSCPLVSAGTVFSLPLGLDPFVETQPTFGKVAAAVKILGPKLTGATSVTFNGTAAVFKVVSSSEITAAVPTGASTGFVTVTTPSGTLTSNQQFRVTPKVTSFTPPGGPVGTSVTIAGVSLAQTRVVTFGGVQATVLVANSDTQVTATVPTDAVTGKITVTTLGGTATSAKSFKVTP